MSPDALPVQRGSVDVGHWSHCRCRPERGYYRTARGGKPRCGCAQR
nr:MAG TPA: hypothetical protein [Caudoviricetes sp.]